MFEASTDSWVSRLRLLDDLPLGQGGHDLFGLEPLVELLVDAIVRTKGSLVVHVDGAWGRGKTSFCSLVEGELEAAWGASERVPPAQRDRVRSARYIASDDEGDGVRSLFYAIAKAIAGPEDPEEAVRIFRQWWDDAKLGGMRMDAFSTWLRHELGRSTFRPARETVSIPLHPGRGSEDGGTMELSLAPNPKRSAVVFVDDLDRCQRERVVEVLELIRRFVACPGLVFVIAADRRLVELAFADIVRRDADPSSTSATEAMEKYIHRRVELPDFSSFNRGDLARVLEPLQQGLLGQRMLWLLSIPTAEFESGVALPVVQALGENLTPRRLKRFLNDFAIDMATYVDREGKAEIFSSREAWVEAWGSPLQDFKPAFEAKSASVPAYYIGRLIVRLCEHFWPSLLAGASPKTRAFGRRCARLMVLAGAYDDFSSEEGRAMLDEVLAGFDEAATTSPRMRRQLLELLSWVEQARRMLSPEAETEMMWRRVESGGAERLRETAVNTVDASSEAAGSTAVLAEPIADSSVPMSASLGLMDDDDDADEVEEEASGERDDWRNDDAALESVAGAGARAAEEPAPARPRAKALEVTRSGRPQVRAPRSEVMRGGRRVKRASDAPRGSAKPAPQKSVEGADELLTGVLGALRAARSLTGRLTDPRELAQLLTALETALATSERSAGLDEALGLLHDMITEHPRDFATASGLLVELVEVIAQHDYGDLGFDLSHAVGKAVFLNDALFEHLRWGAGFLPRLIARGPEAQGEALAHIEDLRYSMVAAGNASRAFADYEWRIWLAGASLYASGEGSWRRHYRSYREGLGNRYANEGGRETTRRYVLLLRAEGHYDPRLELLLGHRWVLTSVKQGDPDIIQALADLLMSRREDEAYAHARTLYLRLRARPEWSKYWTPQVVHNLATAVNALEPDNWGVGALLLDAHRRAPEDLVIRRALSRFLRSLGQREYTAVAIAVSRGEPIDAGFNPFDASAILNAEDPQPDPQPDSQPDPEDQP